MGPIAAMATIVALAGTGIYVGLKSLENYKPNKKKIQRDLELLKREIQSVVSELVPWTEEEMGQLSYNFESKKVSKGLPHTKMGVYTTIYHEPLVGWIYKKYLSTQENSLTYAKTSHHEFTYRTKNGMTDVVVDQELLGQINQNGELFPMKKGEALAFLQKTDGDLGIPVWVGKREVGRMALFHSTSATNPRVFKFIGQMDDREEVFFLALVVLEMLKSAVLK